MTKLTELTDGREVLLAGAAVAVLILAVFVRRIAKANRPDDALSRVALVLGLGWSSEAAWELMAGFPTSVRLAIFAVGEVILIVSMIRVARSVRETGRAGRAGQAVWIVASGMALVGLLAADNFGQGVLRSLVPLGLTLMWWQGVVPEGAKRADGPSSWRWTPRRLLLAVGALEPGERDVETVHRERMIQQMTRLEFRRRGASEDRRERLGAKLARLSLMADDEMIAEVRRRVARASWFTVTPLTHSATHLTTQADPADDAPVTQALTRVVTHTLTRGATQAARTATSGNAGDSDPATQAAQLWIAGGVPSKREAARQFNADPTTVRRRIEELTRVTQPKTNGYQHQLA